MKVVIDIPDYNLDEVQNGSIACGMILKAVKNGQVLPKWHGDLIDRNEPFTEYPEIAIEPYINIQTVIEADKENNND